MPPTLVKTYTSETPAVIREAEDYSWLLSKYVPTVQQIFLNSEIIARSFNLNLNTTAPQTAFTVPPGFEFYLTKYLYSKPSEDLTGSSEGISLFDRDGTVIHEQFLNETISGEPVFNATDKQKQVIVETTKIYTAGDDVIFQMSGVYGSAATLVVDVFGYFKQLDAVVLDIIDGGNEADEFSDIIDGGGEADEFSDIIDGGNS